MRTRTELYRAAQRVVAARRQRAMTRAETARRDAFAANPALASADDARAQAGFALARAALGGDVAAANAALQQAEEAYAAALAAAGYAPDAFAPQWSCPVCCDTGIAQGASCACVARAARELRREEINAASPLKLCKFDSFDLNRYPAQAIEPALGMSMQEYMGKLVRAARRYAEQFDPQSPNLLFMGSAGLGKTHVALAIADTVLESGRDVLYTSAAALTARLSREHFDRDSGDDWLTACQQADLLILDDLGTEYISPVAISVLYELINTRMLRHLPVVYTTNITDQSIFEARYTEKLASRMLGNCKIYKFFGTDQRLYPGAPSA